MDADALQSFLDALASAGDAEQASLRETMRAESEQATLDAKRRADEVRDAYIARKKAFLDGVYGAKRVGKTAGFHRALSDYRGGIEAEVFSAASERIEAFTGTPEYPDRLENTLRRVLERTGGSPVTVYLREADMAFAGRLAGAGDGIEVQRDASIRLGGFIAECAEKRLRFDATYDTGLEKQRQWFYENAGLTAAYEDADSEDI